MGQGPPIARKAYVLSPTARKQAQYPVEAPAPDAPPAAVRPASKGVRTASATQTRVALDDHKRSFLRMVSHELRTPLNAVIGFSEIIARELYGPLGAPQYKEYAEHVRQSGHKLLRLVNQVLEIARLDGHALDVDPHLEPLDYALEDAVTALADDIAAHAAVVEIENTDAAGAPLPSVLADPRGLRNLLVNLIQNAIVHGDGPITVRVRKVGPVVEIAVEDQGPGAPAKDLRRLLKPFQQGEAALTRHTQGAGLGLPIVALLCQAMGGDLTLRSDVGCGFTATVTLRGA
jgi:signal transduction histidine kinase